MAAHAASTSVLKAVRSANETAAAETELEGTMGVSKEDPTTSKNLGLVDNGVMGTG
jgi:hypothetical protein